jgi:hypothetical protein
MFGASLVLVLGFVLSVWSYHEHHTIGMYLGLITIGGVCVSWWFWVMFIIRAMLGQTEKTCSQLKEVRLGITEVKHLVKEYAELKNTGDRQRRKSARS